MRARTNVPLRISITAALLSPSAWAQSYGVGFSVDGWSPTVGMAD